MVNQRLVVCRPVGDGVKRLAHDADLKGMVVIRSPRTQLVPFRLHRFGKQRPRREPEQAPLSILISLWQGGGKCLHPLVTKQPDS